MSVTNGYVNGAVDVLARRVIVQLVEWGLGEAWEDWAPDIGEHDWIRVQSRVEALLDDPEAHEYEAAYKFLAARAENDA